MCNQSDHEDFVPVFGRYLTLRCTAHSKRTGKRCLGFAVHGFSVCRMHGAHGGPKTIAGVQRIAAAQLVHGRETRQLRLTREDIRDRLMFAVRLGETIGMFTTGRKRIRPQKGFK